MLRQVIRPSEIIKSTKPSWIIIPRNLKEETQIWLKSIISVHLHFFKVVWDRILLIWRKWCYKILFTLKANESLLLKDFLSRVTTLLHCINVTMSITEVLTGDFSNDSSFVFTSIFFLQNLKQNSSHTNRWKYNTFCPSPTNQSS
jgi:hypothetical protein